MYLSFSKQLCEKNIFIKPGQKICPSCRNFCEEKTKITENESDDELMIELDSFESRNVSLSQTNAALDDLGLLQLKFIICYHIVRDGITKEKLK